MNYKGDKMNLKELYGVADYKDNKGMCFNGDCIEKMKLIDDESVNFTLTDIPYNVVNRSSNGLRNLDKEKADVITFCLQDFMEETYRITKNSICIFCGKEQFSTIYKYFANKKGTVRPVIWKLA